MRRCLSTLVVSGWMAGAVWLGAGGVWAQAPSANEIVTRMMERNAQRQSMLQHYASDRTYKLEYNGAAGEHHAEMVVHAEYVAPGRKRLTVVSQSGSKVLCAEVLRKLVEGEEETASKQDWQRGMFSPETYDLKLLGREQVDGIPAWVLHVEPKVATKVTYRGRIWVSMDDYATIRVQAEPAKNPSWMLNHASFDARYMRRGEVWVPATNVSTSHVRFGGEAKVTIDYGTYPVMAVAPAGASPAVVAESQERGVAVAKKPLGSGFR